MAFEVVRNNAGNGGAQGEEYLVATPIVANGLVANKRVPAKCLVKNIIVKSTVAAAGFKLGTAPNADDLVYHTDLPAGKAQIYAPFAFTDAVAPLYVSGYAGGVVTVIVIYQKINI